MSIKPDTQTRAENGVDGFRPAFADAQGWSSGSGEATKGPVMMMSKRLLGACLPAVLGGALGCAGIQAERRAEEPRLPAPVSIRAPTAPRAAAGVIQAGGSSEDLPLPRPLAGETTPKDIPAQQSFGLEELSRLGLERHPRLSQAAFAVDTARGRALQAGLYPNPVVSITGDELGDRQGPAGIITAPQVSQEIVTGGKLGLSRAAATKEVDQATLALMTQRYALLASIRSAYFDALATQRRADILAELVKLAERSVAQTETLLKAELVSRLDLVQLEVDLERLRTEERAARRELPAAYRRLAAVVGLPGLPVDSVSGNLDLPLPPYELDRLQTHVLSAHPEPRSARAGVERAQLLVRRAEVEPVPNLTVSSGYVRQNQNRSNDWMLGVSVPVPVWNRNQGNILAARGQLGEAVQEVARVEADLTERLATAYRDFAAARERAERTRSAILPKAQETYDLAVRAYKGGQFEYLRVLQAQRALAEARLELNRALGDAWRAASVVSGLALEDHWPPAPPAEGKKP